MSAPHRPPHAGRLFLAIVLITALAAVVAVGISALDIPLWLKLILSAALSFVIWPAAFAIARPYRR